MLKDFNLLVTTSRGNEEDVCSEMWYLLGEVGDQAAAVDRTGVTGLVVVKTLLDPFEVIEKLRKVLKERPWEFRYTLRIMPIEKVTRTDLGEIQLIATELASKIAQDETFRVTVEKRFSKIPSSELIEAAATNIERKVSLDRPDRIVLLQVIGKLTGVSVVRPTDIMSVAKEKLSPE